MSPLSDKEAQHAPLFAFKSLQSKEDSILADHFRAAGAPETDVWTAHTKIMSQTIHNLKTGARSGAADRAAQACNGEDSWCKVLGFHTKCPWKTTAQSKEVCPPSRVQAIGKDATQMHEYSKKRRRTWLRSCAAWSSSRPSEVGVCELEQNWPLVSAPHMAMHTPPHAHRANTKAHTNTSNWFSSFSFLCLGPSH